MASEMVLMHQPPRLCLARQWHAQSKEQPRRQPPSCAKHHELHLECAVCGGYSTCFIRRYHTSATTYTSRRTDLQDCKTCEIGRQLEHAERGEYAIVAGQSQAEVSAPVRE